MKISYVGCFVIRKTPSTYLLAFCLRKQTIFLGLCFCTLLADESTEDLAEERVNIDSAASLAFRVL